MSNRKTQNTVLILSCFLPGVGHLYLGELKKGLAVIAGIVLFSFVPFLGFLGCFGVYAWSVRDVVRITQTDKASAIRIILIAVISYIALIAIVTASFINLLSMRLDLSGDENTQKRMDKLAEYTADYYEFRKEFPQNIDDVVGQSPIKREYSSDVWGNEFLLSESNNAICIQSKGKDSQLNTSDDISKCFPINKGQTPISP